MSISDDSFREAFKPLHIPAHYNADDTDGNKVIYALAQLGIGNADDIAHKLYETDNSIDEKSFKIIAASLLTDLYNKGLIKGHESNGSIQYNLSKITQGNDGEVNPNLLAPGLD